MRHQLRWLSWVCTHSRSGCYSSDTFATFTSEIHNFKAIYSIRAPHNFSSYKLPSCWSAFSSLRTSHVRRDSMKKIKPDVHGNRRFSHGGRRTWIFLLPTDVTSSFPIRCWQTTSCNATYFILDTVFYLLIRLLVTCRNDDRYRQKIKIKQEIG